MKLPDKREVGSSTLPRPINFRSLPRRRLGACGVFSLCRIAPLSVKKGVSGLVNGDLPLRIPSLRLLISYLLRHSTYMESRLPILDFRNRRLARVGGRHEYRA